MQLNNDEREFAILLLSLSEAAVMRLSVERLIEETGLRRRQVRGRIHALWNAGLRIECDNQGKKFCHIRDFIARFDVEPDALREQLKVVDTRVSAGGEV